MISFPSSIDSEALFDCFVERVRLHVPEGNTSTLKQVFVRKRGGGTSCRNVVMLTIFDTHPQYDDVVEGAYISANAFFSNSGTYNNIIIRNVIIAHSWEELDKAVDAYLCGPIKREGAKLTLDELFPDL